MLLRIVARVWVVVLGLTALQPHARAAMVTLDFDPPAFSAGDTPTSIDGINFSPGSIVFRPAHVTAFTPPQALKGPLTCNDASCSNGAYRMSIRFGTPLPLTNGGLLWRHADSVSVRIGADTLSQSCFPEGTSCPMYARMVGYDQNGAPVADTYDVLLLDDSSLSNPGAVGYNAPIGKEIAVTDPGARIVSVTIYYGKGTFSHDQSSFPGKPQIDHLVVNFPDSPPTPPMAPPPPTIAIAQPTNGSQVSYPYQVRLKGSTTFPGGRAAFCYRLDNSVPAQPLCNDNAALNPDGTFDILIADGDLKAGGNTIAVTAFDLWGQTTTARTSVTTLPPPPPQVSIFYPTANQWLNATGPNTLVGQVRTVGPLQALCAMANVTAIPTPATCTNLLSGVLGATNPLSFSQPLPQNSFAPGPNILSAFAYDRWGQMGRADQTINDSTDFRIVAMEITQGIQTVTLPINLVGAVAYTGATLREYVPTVVRVFANTPNAGVYCCAAMTLSGFVPDPQTTSGERNLGSIWPDSSPVSLTTGDLSVPLAIRADPNGAYVFTLPDSWTTSGTLRLQANLTANYPLQECAACLGNNVFSVFAINFVQPTSFAIEPVALTFVDKTGTTQSPPPSSTAFANALAISPVPPTTPVTPYLATIDVTDLVDSTGGCRAINNTCQDAVFGRIAGTRDLLKPYYEYTIGVGPIDVGLEHLVPFFQLPTLIGVQPIAASDSRRPFTSAGHEFFHELAYYHASPGCKAGSPWIYWPPDQEGLIHGVGLDRRQVPDSTGKWNGTYRVLAPPPFTPPSTDLSTPDLTGQIFDLMSYCANDSNAWISLDNWNSFGGAFPNGVIPDDLTHITISYSAPAVRADGGSKRLFAVLDKSGGLEYIRADDAEGWVRRDAGRSTHDFVVRNAEGALIARVPAMVIPPQGHGDAGTSLMGLVPARDAAVIQVEYDGHVIGELKRSSNPPTIQITSRKDGLSLARNESVKLAWHAEDSDEDKLEIQIAYSKGPDEPFHVVFIGPNRGEWTVPGYLLAVSNAGRLRVVASDGFNQTQTLISSVVVKPAPPLLDILNPAPNIDFPDTTPLRLRAAAFGDEAKPLPKEGLQWSLDGKPLGSGLEVEVRDLKPGKHVARVIARDGTLTSTRQVVFIIHRQRPVMRRGARKKNREDSRMR